MTAHFSVQPPLPSFPYACVHPPILTTPRLSPLYPMPKSYSRRGTKWAEAQAMTADHKNKNKYLILHFVLCVHPHIPHLCAFYRQPCCFFFTLPQSLALAICSRGNDACPPPCLAFSALSLSHLRPRLMHSCSLCHSFSSQSKTSGDRGPAQEEGGVVTLQVVP